MEGGIREDGRKDNQTRVLEETQGLLYHADGSASFAMGNTKVIAAVFGPIQAPSKLEEVDRAVIEVSIAPLYGMQSNKEIRIQSILRRILEALVMRNLHPRCIIRVAIQVFQNDGSLLAACVNAASIALLNARIPMFGIVSAASIGVTENLQTMIDVSLKEEGICQNVLNFAFMSTEDKSELVMTDCQGAGINLDFYEQCMEHARSVCATYRLFMRVSAEKYIQSRFRVCN